MLVSTVNTHTHTLMHEQRLPLFLSIHEEADCGSEVLQVYVGEEGSLEFSFHGASAGTTTLQEHHSRLTQQPVNHFIHSGPIQAGQDTLAPQADVKYVSGHSCTGALEMSREIIK